MSKEQETIIKKLVESGAIFSAQVYCNDNGIPESELKELTLKYGNEESKRPYTM